MQPGAVGRRRRIARCIYQDRYGLSLIVTVGAVQREIRFPLDTPLKDIRAEEDETRRALGLGAPRLRSSPSTLAVDAERYLAHIRPGAKGEQSHILASWRDRERHVKAWVAAFGHVRTRRLPELVPRLNAQLRTWRQRWSANTCNHHRDALCQLVRTLYGRRAALELADLIRFPKPDSVPRWRDRAELMTVIQAFPVGTKTRARLELLYWTGMRPSQLGRLREGNFRLEEPIPYVIVPRGKGGRIACVPLVQDALTAARDFLRLNAWGDWSTPSVNTRIAARCRRLGVVPFTTYTLRHSFSAALRQAGVDLADIQDLYGHTKPETTRIYAPPWLAKHYAAIQRISSKETTKKIRPRRASRVRDGPGPTT